LHICLFAHFSLTPRFYSPLAESADTPLVSVSGSNPLPPVPPSREPRGDASRLEQTNKDRKRRQEEDQRDQSGSKRQKGSDSVQLSADAAASRPNAACADSSSTTPKAPKRLDLNA
jgi:hypothetical protein